MDEHENRSEAVASSVLSDDQVLNVVIGSVGAAMRSRREALDAIRELERRWAKLGNTIQKAKEDLDRTFGKSADVEEEEATPTPAKEGRRKNHSISARAICYECKKTFKSRRRLERHGERFSHKIDPKNRQVA